MVRRPTMPRWIAFLLVMVIMAGHVLSGPLSVHAATPCGTWSIKLGGQDTRLRIVPVTVGNDCRASFRVENRTKAFGFLGGYGLELRTGNLDNNEAKWIDSDTRNPVTMVPGVDLELFLTPKDLAQKAQITLEGAVTQQSITLDMALSLIFAALGLLPLGELACAIPKKQIVFAVLGTVRILAASGERLAKLDPAVIAELLQVSDEFYNKTKAGLVDALYTCGAEIATRAVADAIGLVTGVGGIVHITKFALDLIAYMTVLTSDTVKYQGKPVRATLEYEPAVPSVPVPTFTPTPAPSLRTVDWPAVLARDPDLTVTPLSALQSNPVISCDGYNLGTLWVQYSRDTGVEGRPWLKQILYGDIAGNGGEEAIIPLVTGCSTLGPVANNVLIYRRVNGTPRLITSGPGAGPGFANIEIVNNALEKTTPVYLTVGNRCCPDGYETVRYQLQGDRLVQVGKQSSNKDSTPVASIATPTPNPLPSLRTVDWPSVFARDPDLSVKNQEAICRYGELDISVTYKGAAPASGHPVTSRPANINPLVDLTIKYGDLDGDGREEAVVGLLTSCTGGISGYLIYRMTPSGPRIATVVPDYSDGLNGTSLANRIVNGQLEVTSPVYRPGDSRAGGPSGGTKITLYRIQGSQLITISTRVEPKKP